MSRTSVAVVGAGVAGLATAHRLLASGVRDVTVIEADEEPGGKIRSARVGGLMLEAGPDSLLARKPWGVDLCRELGLGEDLVAPVPSATHIYTDRGLLRFPSGPFGIATDPMELWRWPGMSTSGKVRAAQDLFRRRRGERDDESLGSLLRRRIGDEATDALVAPLLGGLFAADVDRLSVRATFPELEAWERDHGSLFRGARAATKRSSHSKPPPMFLRLRGGLRRLVDALTASIGEERIRSSSPVRRVVGDSDRFLVQMEGGEELAAEAVVLTPPAFAAADLVRVLAPQAIADLRGIPYVSTAVVLLVYPDGTADRLPESSGFVSPRGRLAMTAATFVSRKWPEPEFGGRAVVRCFVGAAGSEDLVDEPDEDIVDGVARQLAAILPLPERPEDALVVRWRRAMPQYEVGHLDRVAAIEAALPAGAFVAGQGYRGAGIPDCVRQAGETAERIQAHLAGRAGTRPGVA